jgi:FSR family fosmidomycin resistance protein-like MFS transporter
MERMNSPRAPATMVTACAAHFLHDGLTDLLYVMFPLWAREFSLSFAQAGLLKTSFSGAMSLFQIPAGFLAERWGEARLLAGGTLISALGFLTLSTATLFERLLLVLLLAGLGSAVQHPISSALVSRAYEEGPRRMALGTYNFSGDLGKMILPAAAAMVASWVGWRWAIRGAGSSGNPDHSSKSGASTRGKRGCHGYGLCGRRLGYPRRARFHRPLGNPHY